MGIFPTNFKFLTETTETLRAELTESIAKLLDVREERRRCIATCADGQPCKAWAMWDAPEQLCAAHLGPEQRQAVEAIEDAKRERPHRRRAPTCNCLAYMWPHRLGNGLCCGPRGEPIGRHPTPAGKRAAGKVRRRKVKSVQQKVADAFRKAGV